MAWPAHLAPTQASMASARSSSVPPERSERPQVVVLEAKRQLRSWPSAVSRIRSHCSQNGSVTLGITPTSPRPSR